MTDNKSLDDQIKEAELAKIKAETAKAELEAADVKNRLKQSRIMGVPVVQIIFGGIVVGFVLLNYIQPLVNLNTDIATKEKDYNEIKDRLERIQLDARNKDLEQLADSLNIAKADQAQKHLAELNQINREYTEIDSIRKALVAKYQRLSQVQTSTQKERDEAKKSLASLQAQNEAQKDRVSKLESQISQQEQRAATLQAEIPVYLSSDAATDMIKRNGYYDEYKNPEGKGITHQYEGKSLNGKKVVFDHVTKLIWQQSGSLEYITYENAKKYIDQLNRERFAGFSDWRLPTLEEAMSLMEPTKKNGDLYIDPVFDAKQFYTWTADLYSASSAWLVHFYVGLCYYDVGIFNSCVCAVRSGQSLDY